MTQTNEAAVERLGEALFALSDRLRANNALADNETHDAYEKVVAAFRALSPFPAETDGIREAALEEAARVVDGMIETYRNSDIAECLAWIEPLQNARDRIVALSHNTRTANMIPKDGIDKMEPSDRAATEERS